MQDTMRVAQRGDFCVGYFNLRGWKHLAGYVEQWQGGDGACCRLLLGMQPRPSEVLFRVFREQTIDNKTAVRLKTEVATELRQQLARGIPNDEEETALRRMVRQIRAGKLIVKVFLRHPLHAKLYMLHREDVNNPITAFLGSSNLTLAGLVNQGELNVDVLDHDACAKLQGWFEDRWNDRFCLDISDELVRVIGESWASETPLPPYHIYIKMVYHLSQEARAGAIESVIPPDLAKTLFPFQQEAVKIAAHHLRRPERGGVLIGDVVGLGKTLTATAVLKAFDDLNPLILCPANLVRMWEDYRERWELRGRVLSTGRMLKELPRLQRYRLLILDESQNFRNREGKRYRALREYIATNDCKVILLSATPYNKSYRDLGAQLGLFVPEERDLGIRPNRLIASLPGGEKDFVRKYQCSPRTLRAFEASSEPEDWRDLLRMFMVRRTRRFIMESYATKDESAGRYYLTMENGERAYFPIREPKTVTYPVNEADQFARLYRESVVNMIGGLNLPRYGLGEYVRKDLPADTTETEKEIIDNLGRAARRLLGYCRTNLFKRLESSGHDFLQSVERHIVRNCVFLYALERGLPLPIGTQDSALLDTAFSDEDIDSLFATVVSPDEDEESTEGTVPPEEALSGDYAARAKRVYDIYRTHMKRQFKWIRADLFESDALIKTLRHDTEEFVRLHRTLPEWDPAQDSKLQALVTLLKTTHPREKVLVFSQFADTVRYLVEELRKAGVRQVEGVTGQSSNPTEAAHRFSPESNGKRDRIRPDDETRVLIATDVLSEGQNLQDCSIVVNYDLPWAIIRLVQRAGRVDRIGQRAPTVRCYTFLPADGVENIIRLRTRLVQRLHQNAEVVGTDEQFFEEERHGKWVADIYHEKAGLLDGEAEDDDTDLTSHAYRIWQQATKDDPELEEAIKRLPDVVYSSKAAPEGANDGVLAYVRTPEGNDVLTCLDAAGNVLTDSPSAILKMAACEPRTPALPRRPDHHVLVETAVKTIAQEEIRTPGGQLGPPSSPRRRVYERLKTYVERHEGTLFISPDLRKAVHAVYTSPLREEARDILLTRLKSGIGDESLGELVCTLFTQNRLCITEPDHVASEPQIVCSLGLVASVGE
ncbi:MAG TPA: helicase-related protein [Candidatus Latescibacteria bacterium]|nr:helicase-related protein [Candidatus Latescibacterota bacterium]